VNTRAAGWRVGDVLRFRASGTEVNGDPLPNTAYHWNLQLRHCDSPQEDSCHTHPLMDRVAPNMAVTAPDHEYYAYLRATLTVTGSNGLTLSRVLVAKPQVSTVTLTTSPVGVPVANGLQSGQSPVTSKYLVGGVVQLAVPAAATVGGMSYRFTGWDDGAPTGPQRQLTAPVGTVTRVALYTKVNAPPVVSNITVSRTTVNGLPATLTFSARARDDSGVTAVHARLTAPDGHSYIAPLSLISGTSKDGTWRGTVRLPGTARGGTYTTRIIATDSGGVKRGLAGPTVKVTR
jgi:hypothetical protein